MAEEDASNFLNKMLPPPPKRAPITIKLQQPPAKSPTDDAAADSPSAKASPSSAFSLQSKAKKEECKEDLGNVAWEYDANPLATGWKRVPSASRPGQFSYQHTSGLKQSKRPTRPPTDSEIAAFLKLHGKKRKRVEGGKKGKGRSVNKLESSATTAGWQSYMKKGKNKAVKLRTNPMDVHQ
jgi:hypothetical protein